MSFYHLRNVLEFQCGGDVFLLDQHLVAFYMI